MKIKLRITLLMTFLSLFCLGVQAQPDCFPEDVLADKLFPSIRLETSMGDIVVELNRLRAPATSNNFLRYVLEGQYDGTIFHRVMVDFVVQGGGYSKDLEERNLHPPVINESGNGLKNMPMTIAMARYDDPHSATSQFYFNLSANSSLDPNARNWGYTVFGEVISGQDVVAAIAGVETGYNEDLDATDVPLKPVYILSATVLKEPH
ncbi:MAG: peptidylprolyl isomerase [Xanthomonadales bacterium]